jgi:hypothetical protein
LTAIVDVTPNTLNLSSNGKFVSGSIQLPAAFFPEEIVFDSIRLQQVIPAIPGSGEIGDTNGDGINELHVKFDRAAFQAVLPQAPEVTVTIDGMVRNRTFSGEDIIRTTRPKVKQPHALAPVSPATLTTITWENPAGPAAEMADIHVSLNDGATWTAVAEQIPNTGATPWVTPVGFYDQCRVMVTLWRNGEIYGQGMSQEPFPITAPLPVRLKAVDVTVEDGDAVLRWETSFEAGMEGFAVIRAESEAGLYRTVNEDLIRASGAGSGGRYEFRDATVTANRTYWYKLQEITGEGPGAEFGPYPVVYTLSYGLEPNVPNPFNPATTIKYALAADGPVSLIVYDVTGRRVRELVNQRQRADAYKVVWDGTNDNGQNVASGMYFYRLAAGSFVQTRKMMLLK